MLEKATRRLTLRELLVHCEKYAQGLSKHYQNAVWTSVSELRELSRPVRKNTSYPSLLAYRNALENVKKEAAEFADMQAYLEQKLEEVLEHAQRERNT